MSLSCYRKTSGSNSGLPGWTKRTSSRRSGVRQTCESSWIKVPNHCLLVSVVSVPQREDRRWDILNFIQYSGFLTSGGFRGVFPEPGLALFGSISPPAPPQSLPDFLISEEMKHLRGGVGRIRPFAGQARQAASHGRLMANNRRSRSGRFLVAAASPPQFERGEDAASTPGGRAGRVRMRFHHNLEESSDYGGAPSLPFCPRLGDSRAAREARAGQGERSGRTGRARPEP